MRQINAGRVRIGLRLRGHAMQIDLKDVCWRGWRGKCPAGQQTTQAQARRQRDSDRREEERKRMQLLASDSLSPWHHLPFAESTKIAVILEPNSTQLNSTRSPCLNSTQVKSTLDSTLPASLTHEPLAMATSHTFSFSLSSLSLSLTRHQPRSPRVLASHFALCIARNTGSITLASEGR